MKDRTNFSSLYQVIVIVVFTSVIAIAGMYAWQQYILSQVGNTGVKTINFVFDYSKENPAFHLKTVDNKTVLCDSREYCSQSVEVFSKNPSSSFFQAIENRFLQGYSSDECWVKDLGTKENIQTAILSYPSNQDPNQPWWANISNCPQEYAEANGVRYFYYDENFPDRYAFFEIGQALIPDSSGNPWQNTFKFVE